MVLAACSIDDRSVGGALESDDTNMDGSGGTAADAGGTSGEQGGTEGNLPTGLQPGEEPLEDPCRVDNGGCDPRTSCTNTAGARTCGACPSGFSDTGQAGCVDVDECTAETHDCFADSGCVNEAGAFSCVCPEFHAGDGRSCTGTPKEFGYLQMLMGDGALYVWNTSTRNNVAAAIPGVSWTSFSTGAVVCGVSGDGALFCWDRATPTAPVRVGDSNSWQKLEGSITSVCGIQTGGELLCWENGNGGVGTGSVSGFTPVAVSPQGSWTAVSVGDYNGKCGVRNGQLFCWGRNVRGMLGIGAGIDTIDLRHDTPQRVGNASDWTSVSVGEAHACGIRSGSLFCWGAAFANGQADDVDAPVRIGDASDWLAVATGVAHSVGVRADGQLFYWGQGFFGAFPSDSQTPLRVGPERSWQPPIYADYALSCATSDGVPHCFGSDANTDPNAPPADVPVQIRF